MTKTASGVVQCATCGVERATGNLPRTCPICADPRQYVPASGQEWLDADDLAGLDVRAELVELEPDLHGIVVRGAPGIGQIAKVVVTDAGNVMVDVPAWIDDGLVAAVAELGELVAIVPSHPHMYGVQSQWSRRLGDVPVWLTEQDAGWLGVHPHEVRVVRDDTEIIPGVTISVPGGHFPGSCVVHWDGRDGAGVLLCGDAIGVNADRNSVTYLWSYPNRIPLSAPDALRIARHLERFDFDRIHDNFRGFIERDGRAVVERSAERHAAWALGLNDAQTTPLPTPYGRISGGMSMRQVRTVQDVAVARRFWCDGVGFETLWASDDGTVAAVGMLGASWHLELVAGQPGPVSPDPLVLHLDGEPDPTLLRRIQSRGGLSVPLRGHGAQDHGFVDPDGYLLILSSRGCGRSHRVRQYGTEHE